nr:polyprotein 1 [Black pepper virus F]
MDRFENAIEARPGVTVRPGMSARDEYLRILSEINLREEERVIFSRKIFSAYVCKYTDGVRRYVEGKRCRRRHPVTWHLAAACMLAEFGSRADIYGDRFDPTTNMLDDINVERAFEAFRFVQTLAEAEFLICDYIQNTFGVGQNAEVIPSIEEECSTSFQQLDNLQYTCMVDSGLGAGTRCNCYEENKRVWVRPAHLIYISNEDAEIGSQPFIYSARERNAQILLNEVGGSKEWRKKYKSVLEILLRGDSMQTAHEEILFGNPLPAYLVEDNEPTKYLSKSGWRKMAKTANGQMFPTSIIKGMYEFGRSAANGVQQYISTAVDNFCDKFWSSMQRCFERAFGPSLERITSAISWFSNVCTNVKQWVTDVVDKTLPWLLEARKSIFMGLALTGLTCLVALLERFLVAAGIIGGYIGLPTTFLSLVITCLCGTECVKYIKDSDRGVSAQGLMTFVIDGCKSLLKTVLPEFDNKKTANQEILETENTLEGDANLKEDVTAQGQFDPLMALNGLVGPLQMMSASKCVQMGRVFAVASQVRNGIVAMQEMCSYIGSNLYGIANKLFGIESSILADLTIILGENVKDWLEECEALTEYMHIYGNAASDVLLKIKRALATGRMIRSKILVGESKVSQHVTNLIQQALTKLDLLYTTAVTMGSPLPRKVPFFLMFVGPPGTGKSTMMNRFVGEWLEDNKLESNDYYSRPPSDAYWSNYKRQTVTVYDDLGAVQRDICDEAELISVISSTPYAVSMAALHEKGRYFDSKMVVACSNFEGICPKSELGEPAAFMRRRNVVVRVLLKPGVEYDSSDPTANQYYEIIDKMPPHNVSTILGEDGKTRTKLIFNKYSDLYNYILEKQEEHEKEQTNLFKQTRAASLTQAQVVENLVNLCNATFGSMPVAVVDWCNKEHPLFRPFAVMENNIYLFQSKTLDEEPEIKILPVPKSIEVCHLNAARKMNLEVALLLENLAHLSANVNPLAAKYAKDIIKKQLINEDLECTTKSQSRDEKELVEALPKWQRLYLHILAETHHAKGQSWYNLLLTTMREKVCELYKSEFKTWPTLLKLSVGVFLAVIVGVPIYKTMSMLWNLGTGAKFLATTATLFSATAQSIKPNRQEVTEYRFRNVPVRYKTWAEGQANFADTAQWVADTGMALLEYGDHIVQAFVLPGSQLVAVNHCLQSIPDGLRVRLRTSTNTVQLRWDKRNITMEKGNELALYTAPAIPAVASSLMERILWDPESDLPKKFKGLFFSNKYNEEAGATQPEVADINCELQSEVINVGMSGTNYLREVPRYIAYQAPTVDKDCGSLIFVTHKGIAKLVGIHVAGFARKTNEPYGMACFLPKCRRLVANAQCSQVQFESYFDYMQTPQPLGESVKAVGIMKPECQLRVTTKSKLVLTPKEWHLGTEVEKEPAILTKHDPRVANSSNPNFDPYTDGMTKYAQESGPFDYDVLESAMDDICEEWQDACGEFDFSEATLDEAINGVAGLEYFDSLVMGTSEGFPYILSRKPGEKGKYRFVHGEPGNYEIDADSQVARDIENIENESIEGVPCLVGIECPKDEKVAIAKVTTKPKTRLFTVMPFSYNLVVRKKFIKFVKFIMEKRHKLACQVGTNVYSRDWTLIANKLHEVGDDILCCDYSRFDGLLAPTVMEIIAKGINKICGGPWQVQKQRENLLMACCNRYGICRNTVFQVMCGIPSGFPLTVILNSIFNELLVRYFYKQIMADHGILRETYKENIRLVVYGDDNLISVHPSITHIFNGQILKTEMAKCGITITDGVDKTLPHLNFRKLMHCDFLKRQFVQRDDGTWKGPMEIASLYGQLHYVKAEELTMQEEYLKNLNSVLLELYIHSEKHYRSLKQRALELKWIKVNDLLGAGKIEGFLMEQGFGGVPFNLSVDLLMNTNLVRGFKDKQQVKTREQLVPRVDVVSYSNYEIKEGDYAIYLGMQSKRGHGGYDNFLVLNYRMGSGRGGLPTAEYMRQTILAANSDSGKRLRHAYNTGRNLVFVGSDTAAVATIVAALFLSSAGVISKTTANTAISYATMQATKAFPEFAQGYEDLI